MRFDLCSDLQELFSAILHIHHVEKLRYAVEAALLYPTLRYLIKCAVKRLYADRKWSFTRLACLRSKGAACDLLFKMTLTSLPYDNRDDTL